MGGTPIRSRQPRDSDLHLKKIATYVSDLAATFLSFTRDAEAPYLVLGEYLERICIQTEAAHGRLIQDEDM